MHNCAGVHCALRLPHHYVLSRVTALTLLRFGGTVLLAPHESAVLAGLDLMAACSSSADCDTHSVEM